MSQINVNTITGKDGGSAVNFPDGITVTGVVTATTLNQNVVGVVTATTFDGNVTGNLTGNVTGNCSGTAGSTGVLSAGATGADLTLSGNLTVNGTTTTIDTAVTSVDSLAVDGSVGIGTTNPSAKLSVAGDACVSGVITATNFAKADGSSLGGFSPDAQYNLYAGKWGYQTIGDSIFVDSNYFSQDYYLSPAYYDDFVLDFGWTTSGGA